MELIELVILVSEKDRKKLDLKASILYYLKPDKTDVIEMSEAWGVPCEKIERVYFELIDREVMKK